MMYMMQLLKLEKGTSCRSSLLPPYATARDGFFFSPFLYVCIFLLTIFSTNVKITSRTPGKAGNTGHGPEYHQPPPVNVPHKYRARQAASLWERESTRRQGRGNEVAREKGPPQEWPCATRQAERRRAVATRAPHGWTPVASSP